MERRLAGERWKRRSNSAARNGRRHEHFGSGVAFARRNAAAALLPWAIGLVTAIDYFDNALFAFFASYIAGGVNASPDELVWASSAYALGAVLGIL